MRTETMFFCSNEHVVPIVRQIEFDGTTWTRILFVQGESQVKIDIIGKPEELHTFVIDLGLACAQATSQKKETENGLHGS